MTLPEPHRIEVGTNPPYVLHIGPSVARQLPAWLAGRRLGDRYALVSDATVMALHGGALRDRMAEAGLRADALTFPAGEIHKTRATKEALEDALVEAGFGRDGAVVALGGGVVTDMAGFVAATYHRGIPYVTVPTTLLAMVDASIGGKTGLDHPRGKNLIGAFHQPAAVFIDVDHLATLPDRDLRCGLAEVVKVAVARDADLFRTVASGADRLLARDPVLLSSVIARACAIKAEVVAADEKESDLRLILNLGHTVGHALESATGYAIAHGEAVAIGLVAETRMAVRIGLLDREAAGAIEEALARLGLPVRPPAAAAGLDATRLLEAARRDKKARGGRIVYVLPSAIGAMARGPAGYGIPLEETPAAEVLSDMLRAASGE